MISSELPEKKNDKSMAIKPLMGLKSIQRLNADRSARGGQAILVRRSCDF